jgi:hypothetical protein
MKTTIVLLSTAPLLPFSWSQGMNVQETEINPVSELLSKMTWRESCTDDTNDRNERAKPSVFDMVKLRDALQLSFRLDVKCSQSWSSNDTTMERSNHHNK